MTVSADQFGSNSMSSTRASALFPASGVRPNFSVPEMFQSLPKFRSVAVARTRPVAGASAVYLVWSCLSLSHGLCLCASRGVSQRPMNGRQTHLSSWSPQKYLTKRPCHR